MRRSPALFTVSVFGLLMACANTGAGYRPVVDGPVNASYESDLSQCQSLAASGATVDGNTAGSAVAGAGLGAASSVIWNGNSSNLGEAAAVGALAGLTKDAFRKNAQREAIVKNCMRGRGYNVVG
jgi:hypothetical protein